MKKNIQRMQTPPPSISMYRSFFTLIPNPNPFYVKNIGNIQYRQEHMLNH